MSTVLKCKQLRSGYGEMEILSGIDIELKKGEIYALVGKNGAGKTTFIKTLLSVLPIIGGTISFFDKPSIGLEPHQVVSLGISCAPQDRALFNELTVNENLRLGALKLSSKMYARELDRIVDMFPIVGDRRNQQAGTLSGGEQAMVKVARALLPLPKIVLLDEVTEGLQPMIVNHVQKVILRDHKERNTTFLIVEQNVDFVHGLASRYGLIQRGVILTENSFANEDAMNQITNHLRI